MQAFLLADIYRSFSRHAFEFDVRLYFNQFVGSEIQRFDDYIEWSTTDTDGKQYCRATGYFVIRFVMQNCHYKATRSNPLVPTD